MQQGIVYFLGAGCSKNFGYPLTGEIMPGILENLSKKDLFQLEKRKTFVERKQENELLKFIELLYPGLRGLNLRTKKKWIPSITEILSLVDHLCFYSIPPHPRLSEENLLRFRYLLNRAVAELLMDYQNMPYKPREERLLKEFMSPIVREKKRANISIITTNYDLSIDPEFENVIADNRVDYGIAYRGMDRLGTIIQQPPDPLFRYYKLHGSLNWLKCELCGQYYIHPDGTIAHQAFREEIDDQNTCACNDHLKLKTVLVAPSLVRDIRDSNLLQIWKTAMEAIRTADRLVFIGYSLPAEDLAIKSVIMRGLNGRAKGRPLNIEVVQQGLQAKQNYINLFGRGIKYYQGGLSEYLNKAHISA
jgi:NAD-dependent SIR2 family protein deacetylase